MHRATDFRPVFDHAAQAALGAARAGETMLVNFYGERSDFVRFNHSQLRQPGSVEDCELTLDVIAQGRRVSEALRLTQSAAENTQRIAAALTRARAALVEAPIDPYLNLNGEVHSGEHRRRGRLPEPGAITDAIARAGQDRDMVGIYAGGTIAYGFANSLGQRNWNESESFNLDWCFYQSGDKAVKASYAGFDWEPAALDAIVAGAADKLAHLKTPPRTIPAGEYRAYLTPAALGELMGWLSYDSFGLASHKTRSTAFVGMLEGGAQLSPLIDLRENTAEGVAPSFQSEGFVSPDEIRLIEEGRLTGALISPRSAHEYAVKTNGASEVERPHSLDMAAGTLPEASILEALGTGVYVSNLWYVNYSDRNEGRLTGMTRFASFWVEKGRIVAPLNVMRFDDSIYRIFGSELEALTAERQMLLDPGTYDRRSVDSQRLPGALLKSFRFTL